MKAQGEREWQTGHCNDVGAGVRTIGGGEMIYCHNSESSINYNVKKMCMHRKTHMPTKENQASNYN